MLACVATLSMPAWAQGFFGSVVGNVADSSHAMVPGATVTLTNLGTNERHVTKTGSGGEYSFVNLNPANYRIDIEMAGFKRLTRQPVVVQVEASARIDAELDPGAVSETVTVTTDTPQLDTDSASNSTEVEGKRVQELPLNGRNVTNLFALVPGVVQQAGNAGPTGLNKGTSTGTGAFGNFQVAGGFANFNAVFIDGAPDMLLHNSVSLVPTQDGVQEFRVFTNDAPAEYGRYMGGVVTLTTKSGSNQFHGTAYEYVRNNLFNANLFFDKYNGANLPRPKYNLNQYGGTIGGPVLKNKLFFFFGFEKEAIRITSQLNTNVPTAAQRTGLFNKKITFSSAVPTSCYSYPTATSTQISTACFDPTAQDMLNYYYPLPNSTGSSNYVYNIPVRDNQRQYTARVDYNLGAKQHLFAKYANWTITDLPASPFNNTVNANTAFNTAYQYVLGDVYTFNPTTNVDLRLSVMRHDQEGTPVNLGEDLSKFGANYGALQSQLVYRTNPYLTFTGGDAIQSVGGNNIAARFAHYDIYDLAGDFTKIFGKHTLKFGGDIRLFDEDLLATGNSGSFTFQNTGFATDEVAAFLLGLPSAASFQLGTGVRTYDYYQGYYGSDVWQVSPKLTINAGLRWELPGGISEVKNRGVVLLPNTTDPLTGVKGTLAQLGSSLYPHRATVLPQYDLFAPRVGFAYRLDEQTVIRAGYGLSYLPNDPDTYLDPSTSSLIQANTTLTNQSAGTNIYYTLSNPLQTQGQLIPVQFNSAGVLNPNFMQTQLGQTLVAPYPFEPFAYIQQYNFTLGHQFVGDLSVEAAYIGSKGTHLANAGLSGDNGYNSVDQLNPQYYSMGTLLTSTKIANPPSYYPGETLGQSLRPLPAYSNVYSGGDFTCCTSNYNSLQLKAEKRFRSGGVVSANYTWAKSLSNTDQLSTSNDYDIGFTQNFDNMKSEYSLLSADVAHRFVISYVTPLPFGKGQMFAHFGGVGGVLVSGWTFNGITTFQSGFPLPLKANNNVLASTFGAGTIRPDYLPGAPGCNSNKLIEGSAQSRLTKWFNTACFVPPGNISNPNHTATGFFANNAYDTNPNPYGFALGNERRVDDSIHAAGVANYDMSLVKATAITERINFQLRAEAFNIFNRVQFQPPGFTVDGKNFGVVTAQANQPRLLQFSGRVSF